MGWVAALRVEALTSPHALAKTAATAEHGHAAEPPLDGGIDGIPEDRMHLVYAQ